MEGIDDPRKRILTTLEFRGKYIKQGGFCGCSFMKIISEVPQGSVKINTQVINQKTHFRQFFVNLVSALDNIDK